MASDMFYRSLFVDVILTLLDIKYSLEENWRLCPKLLETLKSSKYYHILLILPRLFAGGSVSADALLNNIFVTYIFFLRNLQQHTDLTADEKCTLLLLLTNTASLQANHGRNPPNNHSRNPQNSLNTLKECAFIHGGDTDLICPPHWKTCYVFPATRVDESTGSGRFLSFPRRNSTQWHADFHSLATNGFIYTADCDQSIECVRCCRSFTPENLPPSRNGRHDVSCPYHPANPLYLNLLANNYTAFLMDQDEYLRGIHRNENGALRQEDISLVSGAEQEMHFIPNSMIPDDRDVNLFGDENNSYNYPGSASVFSGAASSISSNHASPVASLYNYIELGQGHLAQNDATANSNRRSVHSIPAPQTPRESAGFITPDKPTKTCATDTVISPATSAKSCATDSAISPDTSDKSCATDSAISPDTSDKSCVIDSVISLPNPNIICAAMSAMTLNNPTNNMCTTVSAVTTTSVTMSPMTPENPISTCATASAMTPAHTTTTSVTMSPMTQENKISTCGTCSAMTPAHTTTTSVTMSPMTPENPISTCATESAMTPAHTTTTSGTMSSMTQENPISTCATASAMTPAHTTTTSVTVSPLSPENPISTCATASAMTPAHTTHTGVEDPVMTFDIHTTSCVTDSGTSTENLATSFNTEQTQSLGNLINSETTEPAK